MLYLIKIKNLIQKYKLGPFITAAILIIFFDRKIAELLCAALGYAKGDFSFSINYPVFVFTPPVVLCVFLFAHIRKILYKIKTDGRDYDVDHSKYGLNYKALLDIYENPDTHKMDTDSFKFEKWYESKGIIFGQTEDGRLVKIPSNTETNIAVFGPPGSGKTAGFAIINALRFKGSVLAIDIKGDIYNYAKAYRKIVRFCPDSPNALNESAHFDPFKGINNMSATDKRLYIENMASIIIPTENGDGYYFSSHAQTYLQGIIYLMLSQKPKCTFPEVVHAILAGDPFSWVEYARSDKNKCVEARELLSPMYGNNEKNISGIYEHLCHCIRPLSINVLDKLLSPSDSNCISIETLENGYDIYLQISQEHLNAYAPLLTLIIQTLSTAFTTRADSSSGVKNRPILMLLDEFPQLTFSYDLIDSNLATLRSKGVIIAIIQQNMAQLQHRYSDVGARAILGNCNYQVILGTNDITSSTIFSKMIGKQKCLKVSKNVSKSRNNTTSGNTVQESEEYVYPPEEFGSLPSQGKLIIYAKGEHLKCSTLNCYKDRLK